MSRKVNEALERSAAESGNCCRIPDSCNGLRFAGDGPTAVTEMEVNAQSIWGTYSLAFPDQFRWFGLATLTVG